MFKLLHFIIFVSFALLLSACGSLTTRHASTYIAATPVVSAPVFPVEAVIDFPPMEVKELPIPVVPLHERARVVMSESEVECMARNMYHEARGEGDVGMVAVGYVVLNRMASKQFKSNSVCGIVHQSGIVRKTGKRSCQFSWVCAGRTVASGSGSRASYERALTLARAVMLRTVENPIDDSIYFHNTSADPGFARKAMRASIGSHRFYASI